MTTITTRRLALEPLTVSHADEMVRVLADRALYDHTGGSPPTLADLRSRYRSLEAGPADPAERWRNWIVRETASGRPVGYVQATIHGDNAEMAWLIGVDHQGHGYATEAALAMAAWLRADGIRQLSANIHPHHLASQRVAAAAGLVDTGLDADDGEIVWRRSDPLRGE